MAVYQTVLLSLNYLQFAIFTGVREYKIDITGVTDRSVQMPDVTFCNLNPFASNASTASVSPTIEEYRHMVFNVTRCIACNKQQARDMEKLRDHLLTTEGYYINIGRNNAQRLSHTRSSFIVSCEYMALEGMQSMTVPCHEVGSIVEYHDYSYYTCFTLQMPQSTYENPYYGFRIVLHKDNFFAQRQRLLYSQWVNRHISGMSMRVHERGLPPIPHRDELCLPTGSHADVKLSFSRRNRLPKPYGNCVEDKISVYLMNTSYAQTLCYAMCVQKHVLERCNCLDNNLYDEFSEAQLHSNVNSCLDIGKEQGRLLENWSCIQRERVAAEPDCDTVYCQMPCHEILYEKQVSMQ